MTRSQQFACWSLNTVEICWGDFGKVKRSKFSTPKAIFKRGYFLWVVGGVISSCVFKQNPNHSTIHRFLGNGEVNRATPWGLQHGCIGRFNRPGDIQYQVIHINRLFLFLLFKPPSCFLSFNFNPNQVYGIWGWKWTSGWPTSAGGQTAFPPWKVNIHSGVFVVVFLKHCFDLEQ